MKEDKEKLIKDSSFYRDIDGILHDNNAGIKPNLTPLSKNKSISSGTTGIFYGSDYKLDMTPNSTKESRPSSIINLNGLSLDNCNQQVMNNKINDIIIKQLDLGYFVKVGSQTLAISSKEELINFFIEYINEPIITNKKIINCRYHNRRPKIKKVGVIASSLKDFILWREPFFENEIGNGTQKKFKTKAEGRDTLKFDEIEHICILSSNNCRGIRFDTVIETPMARRNEKYNEILDTIQITLSNNDLKNK